MKVFVRATDTHNVSFTISSARQTSKIIYNCADKPTGKNVS